MQGEAFFEVQKDPEHGLEITAPHETKIEVLGTSFNVEAFEKDPFVATTLINGKVRFGYMKNGRMTAIEMKPGQKLTYDSSSSRAQLAERTASQRLLGKTERLFFMRPLYRKLYGCWRSGLM